MDESPKPMRDGSSAKPGIILEYRDVHKRFRNLHVLKGVTFNVERGETVVLIGKSGSGKSTLLRCTNLLEPIQAGEILFRGRNIKDYNRLELREDIGIVFQSYNLFPHYSALENCSLALRVVKKKSKEEAEQISAEMLRKVGLDDKMDSYPRHLSGGQQQRVAIARSLALNPSIMMFDEVTSALDPELIGEVLRTMEDLARGGMTMIVVTHEMGFAKHVAKKVVFLHEGSIAEIDTPEKVFDNPQDENLQRFLRAILK
jgi:polar amino acid transport system ATP-binding protein